MGIFNKLRSLFSKGQNKDAIPASEFDQEQEQFVPQTAETDPEYLQTFDSAASQTSQHQFVPDNDHQYSISDQDQYTQPSISEVPEYLQTSDSSALVSIHPLFVSQDEQEYQYQSAEDGGVIITKYLGILDGRELRVPDILGGLPVTEIGSLSFVKEYTGDPSKEIDPRYCSGVTYIDSLYLPDTIHTIGDCAFTNIQIRSLHLPSQLVTIGNGAFFGYGFLNKSFKNITFPNKLKSIGSHAFYDPDGLRSIRFTSCIETVRKDAFSGCSSLEEVVFEQRVSVIEDGAFFGCDNLKKVIFQESLSRIGPLAFSACTSLESIVLPDSIQELGYSCFSDCTSLESIVLPDSIQELGNGCFSNCLSLRIITLPATAKFDGASLLKCPNLQMIHLTRTDENEAVRIVDGVLVNENELLLYLPTKIGESYKIPTQIKRIGNAAFSSNPHLRSIVCHEAIKEIGSYAFMNCINLEELVLGSRVSKIGTNIFDGCEQLTIYTVPGSATEKKLVRYSKYAKTPIRINDIASKPKLSKKKAVSKTAQAKTKETKSSTRSVKPISVEDTKDTITKPIQQTEEGRRVVVDFAFSISIPESYDYSLTPPDFVSGIIRHENVLVAVRRGSDIQEYHEAPDMIAVRPLMRAGRSSYTDIKSAEGQEYIDDILKQMTQSGQLEWETLVDREDLLIGFQENSYFAKMFFNAGVFCNKGMYDFTFAFDRGTKEENAQKVREILLSIQPVDTKKTTTTKKAERKKPATPDKGRILVDKNWSIAIPEGYKASANPKEIGDGSVNNVLAMVPNGKSLKNFFSGGDSISAMKVSIPEGRYESLYEPDGQDYVKYLVDYMTANATTEWEVLIKRENIMVGYCEINALDVTRYAAGVFTNRGMYMLQLYFPDESRFRRDERAREVLFTIHSIDDPEETDEPDNPTLPESTTETKKITKPTKTKPASKAETIESLRRKIPEVKPKFSDEYYDFTVNRVAKNWLGNIILGAIEKTGFISVSDDSAAYELSSLDHENIIAIFEELEKPNLSIADDAKRFLEVLHDSLLDEDEQSNLYTFPLKGKIARFEMLESFQSFAWCVQSYASDSNTPLDAIPIDTLILICKLIENREYVCYTEDSYCPQLCKIMAYGNFFTEFTVDSPRITFTMSVFELQKDKHGSLSDLREELASLLEPIRKIYQYLLELKQNDEQLDNMLQVVLSVWCTFVLAAHEDFQLAKPLTERDENEYDGNADENDDDDNDNSGEFTEEIELVGTGHDGRTSANEALSVGDPVSLERNADNPYDSNAIEVFNEYGQSLGHVPRYTAGYWASLMDNDSMRILHAEVVKTVPLSQRSSRARNPVTVIEVTYERD